MDKTNLRIGFVGAGKMATALAKGFLSRNITTANNLLACDVNAEGLKKFCEATGTRGLSDSAILCRDADIVFFAVKPADLSVAVSACGSTLSSKLAVSIAAGVTLSKLASLSPSGTRWFRVMPNTPALVGSGASVLCASELVSAEEKNLVRELFSAVGICLELPEKHFDIVTGLSGSSPAFVFCFIQALSDAGVMGGLTRSDATTLAAQTVLGSAKMVLETSRHPASLRDDVASPGGTTIAGLLALDAAGFSTAVHAAVAAAARRSKELSD
jgi:pyrroline-5-carboxylate reductase